MTSTAQPFARLERAALADLLDDVGPDAPTLCAGWTTYDLAAHLVVRERRPDATAGIVLPPLARWTGIVQGRAKRAPYPQLVDKVRGGPPALSPFALPGADSAANTIELFVHHEDVRRAAPGWVPRELPAERQDELWARLRRGGRMLFRRAGVGVELRRPGGESVTARGGPATVTVTGEPAELLLYAVGRRDHALVELSGEPADVERLAGAALGI
ncbi:MAG: TIGR03085 family metal-binding protein [Frankiaceae bacterium]